LRLSPKDADTPPTVFFPIGDDNPRRGAPLATGFLIAVNVAVFVGVNLRLSEPELREFFLRWGFDAAHPFSVQVLTSMFLHGDVLHLLGNMWFFWIVGDNVEDRLGRPLYLLLYLAAGFAATSVYTAIASGGEASVEVLREIGREHPPLVGASGAVFGALGMYLVFFPKARVRLLLMWFPFPVVRWPSIAFIGMTLALELFRTAMSGAASGGVATAAHVGGGVFGIVAALLAKQALPAVEPEPEPERTLPAARADAAPAWGAPDRSSMADPGELAEVLTSLVRAGDLRRAIDVYPAWRSTRPRDPLPTDVQVDIAHEYYRQWLPKDAIEAYRRALADDPDGPDAPEAAFRIGVLYSQGLRDARSAGIWLRRAIETHHDPAVVAYARRELQRLGA